MMRRRAIIAALVFIGLGVVLGATVFRTDVAQATGLAQAVTVDNTAANPVPVKEQNLDGSNIRVHEEGTASTRSANDEVGVTQRFTGIDTLVGCSGGGDLYTVPVGKEFVALYAATTVLGQDFTSTGTSTAGHIDTGSGPTRSVALPLLFGPEVPTGFTTEESSASEAVHYVFPSGTTLEFGGIIGDASACTFDVSVGGYLQPSS